MKRITFLILIILSVAGSAAHAQKKLWADRLIATNEYMQKHLWNAASGNFVRRADQQNSPGSDAWGITIVLDAYAYMIEDGLMKPEDLKRYYTSSSAIYEKTNGTHGNRILARQGDQIYVGGDDDMQWCAALVHCYTATKDSEYLNAAKFAFNGLIALGFWKDGKQDASGAQGWSWNSNDRRPNGVSTAYGALSAARLFKVTGDIVYKQWAFASLAALTTPQVGFFPRDMMVAADAALTIYDVTKQEDYRAMAEKLYGAATISAFSKADAIPNYNPTDVGDLADGMAHFAVINPKDAHAKTMAMQPINTFLHDRSNKDIAEHGFYSKYDTKGHPLLTAGGSYLGVPLNVPYLPEVAEMLKLFAIAYKNSQ